MSSARYSPVKTHLTSRKLPSSFCERSGPCVVYTNLTIYRPYYSRLPEDDRCRVLAALSKLPCAATGCLKDTESTLKSYESAKCTLCDNADRVASLTVVESWDSGDRQAHWRLLCIAIRQLIASPGFTRSSRPRILVTIAIQRLFAHSLGRSELDLATAPLGQWCMRSLHSSLRELRLAAGYIPTSQKQSPDTETCLGMHLQHFFATRYRRISVPRTVSTR